MHKLVAELKLLKNDDAKTLTDLENKLAKKQKAFVKLQKREEKIINDGDIALKALQKKVNQVIQEEDFDPDDLD